MKEYILNPHDEKTRIRGRRPPESRPSPVDEYRTAEDLRKEADAVLAGKLNTFGRDPVRVAAGLKAAATRIERGHF